MEGRVHSEGWSISLSSWTEADDEARSRQVSGRGMVGASVPREELCLWDTA